MLSYTATCCHVKETSILAFGTNKGEADATVELCGVAYFLSLPQYLRIGAGTPHPPFSSPLKVWGAAAMTQGTARRAQVDANSQRAGRTEWKLAVPRAGREGLHLKEAYTRGHCKLLLSYMKGDFPQCWEIRRCRKQTSCSITWEQDSTL